MDTDIYSSRKCLEAVIGLKGACDPPAWDLGLHSAVYLDQLGITELELRDYLTAAHPTVADLFKDCRAMAIETIANRVENYIRRLYRPASLLDSLRVGYLSGDLDYQAPIPDKLVGYYLEINRPDSCLSLLISSVSLQLEYGLQQNYIVCMDLDTGEGLYSLETSGGDGLVMTYPVHWVIPATRRRRRLFIGYDASIVSGIKSTLTTSRSGCSSCAGKAYRPWSGLELQGGTVDVQNPIYSTLTKKSTAAGLSLVTSVVCDHEGWLCGLSRSLSLPLLYATAREVYDRAIRTAYADRLTPRTADPERLRELRAEFAVLADNSITNLLGTIAPPQDELCYICDQKLKTVISLP